MVFTLYNVNAYIIGHNYHGYYSHAGGLIAGIIMSVKIKSVKLMSVNNKVRKKISANFGTDFLASLVL